MITRTTLFNILFLAVLCALPPLSIDMGLPSLPTLGAAFGVNASDAALTISLFMAGFALSPVVYGTLSDRWGRRPLLIMGLLLFAGGGVACLFAPDLGWLLGMRFIQGLGAGCGPTLAFAASRDKLSGHALGQRLAMLTMLLNGAPIIAPSLGTIWLIVGGWIGSYIVLAIGGVLLLVVAFFGFQETIPPDMVSKEAAVFTAFLKDIRIVFRRSDILLPGLVYGLSAGSMFAYVSTSPLLFMQGLGVSAIFYAGLFAMTGTATCLGAYTSGRALHHSSPLKLMGIAQILMIIGPIGAFILLRMHVHAVFPVISCMVVAMFGYGLIAPASAHATLEPEPALAGTASAMMNSCQMTSMALASFCAAMLFRVFNNLAAPTMMLAFALLSLFCLWRLKYRAN